MLRIFLLTISLIVNLSYSAKEDFRLKLARRLADKGDLEQAIKEYRTYLAENPSVSTVYKEMGDLRLKQKNYKLAAQSYQQALKLDPQQLEAQEALAEAFEAGGEREKAIIEWRKLATLTQSPSLKEKSEKHIAELLYEAPAAKAPDVEMKKSDSKETSNPVENSEKPKESKKSAESEKIVEPKKTEPKQLEVKNEGTVKDEPSPVTKKSSTSNDKNMDLPIFKEAVDLYQAGKNDDAIKKLRETLVQQPAHPGAYYYAGVIRYNRGELDKAEYNLKRSITYPELGFNANFYLGRISQRRGNKKEAIQYFTKYLQGTQSDEGKKQAESILAELRKEIASNSPNALNTTGGEKEEKPKDSDKQKSDLAEQTGENESSSVKAAPIETRVALNASLVIVIPDRSGPGGAEMQKAADYFAEAKLEKAIQTVKDVALRFGGSPNAAASRLNLAALYARLGLHDHALEQANAFLAGEVSQIPNYRAWGEFVRAIALNGNQRFKESIEQLLKIKSDPQRGPLASMLHYQLAQAQANLEMWDKAAESIKLAMKDQEALPKMQMLYQAGDWLLRSKKYQQAQETFSQVLKDCSDAKVRDLCADALLRSGDIQFRLKQWNAALSSYQKAINLKADHQEAAWLHYQISNVYREKKQFDQALKGYKKVMDEYPDSYWAAQSRFKREDTIWEREYKDVLN